MSIPQELETEQAILGAVMVHPKVMADLYRLKPEHFHDVRNATLWRCMLDLERDALPIDVLSIYETLRRDGKSAMFEVVGGRDYLVGLMDRVVTVENIGWHAKRLVACAKRRQWLGFAQRLAVRALDESVGSEEFLEEAERNALELTARVEEQGGPLSIKPVMKEAHKLFEARSDNRSKGGLSGISWGYSGLDAFTQGLHGNEYFLIAGRPSMGKTALALNVVANLCRTGVPCLVFSVEMGARSLAERLIARESKVQFGSLKSGRLNQSDWIAVTGGMSRMSNWPLWIDERGGIDVHEIRSTARRWNAERKEKCSQCATDGSRSCVHRAIVIDYIGLISAPVAERRGQQNRERELSEISRSCKLMAKELNVPVIALSQLNRGLEQRADKRPMLSDLRESGALEQDADAVMFIYRDHVYEKASDPEEAEVIIAKQREGATGTVGMKWNANLQQFSDAPKGLYDA